MDDTRLSFIERIFSIDDVASILVEFLKNDAIAIGRLSMCSKLLLRRFSEPGDFDPWKLILKQYYTRQSPTDTEAHILSNRGKFLYRYCTDREAEKQVRTICHDLESAIRSNRDRFVSGDSSDFQGSRPMGIDITGFGAGVSRSPDAALASNDDARQRYLEENFLLEETSPSIDMSWSHPTWPKLLACGLNVYDHMWRLANYGCSASAISSRTHSPVYEKILKFVSCQALRNLRTVECLCQWREYMTEIEAQQDESSSSAESFDHYQTIENIEKLSILACRIQQTPPEILKAGDVSEYITAELDSVADACRERSGANASFEDRIDAINSTLFDKLGFSGNFDDYYNYRNSLLDKVIESKKGIPLTLCILYACICKRLAIKSAIIGLPGHVVLRVFDENNQPLFFVDTFHEGRRMTLADCQRIANSYGFVWDDRFSDSLAPRDVLTRVNNNLNNCHSRQRRAGRRHHDGGEPPERNPYCEDLDVPLKIIMVLNRQPELFAPFVTRFYEDIPLVLSRGTLSMCMLIAPGDNGYGMIEQK